ncbi:hypothetical protein [Fimbriiglobus ruber]|uniref:hypothetical protein n=1 Tax=Fimbriiglobus ruber TaxID=1908690 RepID=UPI00117AAB5D|nr:hypothetical protein [Fimbriiglobus ruber]
MARFWKERITDLRPRDDEAPSDLTSLPADRWPENLRSSKPPTISFSEARDNLLPVNWIYCVEVCGFTFRFATLTEIARYRAYFAAKHLPSQRQPNPRCAKNTGDRRRTVQTPFARLPLRLKTKARRAKIAKTLDNAIRYFFLKGNS